MALTPEFTEAVQSGKILRIRIIMKDSLIYDPSANEFDEMEHYAIEKLGNIYTEHDGEQFNFDKAFWTEEYLNREMVAVVNCFSRERINFLKRMVQYLYKDKIKKIRTNSENVHTKESISRKQIGFGAVSAGAVLTVSGIFTSQMILTISGAAVTAAGIFLIASDKRNTQ